MNRRRVSSPPTRERARSSRPLSPSHRARRASRDRIDDRGTESTIARANHTECDDFHAGCVDRVTVNVRVARNGRRVRRGRRGLPRASSFIHSFISFIHFMHSTRGRARGGDTHTLRVTTHHTTFRVFFLPKRAKKNQKNQKNQRARKAHATRMGGRYTRVMTQHRETRARGTRRHARARSRGNDGRTRAACRWVRCVGTR